MAPPPEYDKEPKAPDKSTTNISGDETKDLHNLVNDQQVNSDSKSANTTAGDEIENNKTVEHLDDGQLKALLDEAIAYKNPKDRENKSSLFKVLLKESEKKDQQALEAAAARELTRGQRRGRGRRLAPSNSLQNLEPGSLPAEAPPRHARTTHASVSARATHGGSLPADVHKSFLLNEEPSMEEMAPGTGPAMFKATVSYTNPSPLAERRVSASDANDPTEMESLNRRSKPPYPMMYATRKNVDVGGSSVSCGRAVTTTTASNQVDSAIPFNCITSSEVVDSCNTTSSTSQSTVAEDSKPRTSISSSFNGLPLARNNYGSTASTAPDEYKKSLDENGNAVQGSPVSGSSQHKKARRKKSSKNETVIKSEQIQGHKGNITDLDELLRYIEPNAEHGRGHKLPRKNATQDDDKPAKKRSAERRKDKETKVKRASSLEELSRTKLEDLTDKPAAAAAPAKPERRSWGDDARDAFYFRDEDAPPDADFQTVTKKRKPRRRTDESCREPGAGDVRAARAPEPRARRVSAPPSDRSDSNDDLDSVHSLPAARPPAAASYADIARTRHNIPDLIESCNFYAEAAAARGPHPDAYPALEPPPAPRRAAPPAKPALPHTRIPARNKESRAAAECPAPDVVSDRRPPVILLDSESRPRDMDGITFGFDINEQLLGGAGRRPRCDLVRDALETACGAGEAGEAGPARACALRYLPPEHAAHHLMQVVDYVSTAWEDVVRCGSGKVRYFSE